MRDIKDKNDIRVFVDEFYKDVLKDEDLKVFFARLDFQKHLPKMIHFWSFVLLNESGYKTDVTKVHKHMPLEKKHFDKWIELFNKTMDRLFEGELANKAKQRAFLMRWTMESKISGE